MDNIKEKFKEKALPMAAAIKDVIKTHGNFVLGQYTVEQVYQGMKGMIGMVTETSKLDANEGIRFRGYSIPELREKLPVSKEGLSHYLKEFFICCSQARCRNLKM